MQELEQHRSSCRECRHKESETYVFIWLTTYIPKSFPGNGMVPLNLTDSPDRNWYLDKSNPINKGNTRKLSRGSFPAMKRVSPYALESSHLTTGEKVKKPMTASLESGQNLATHALLKVLSAEQVDWGSALKLLQRGGDPLAYRGDAFRPNILFKVIFDITNMPKSEVNNFSTSKERESFIELLLEKEGIESTLLEFDSTPFENTPFTAAIAARDKSYSRAIFNYLKKTNHELLITPNKKTLERQFGNNTPLILAIKTNNEELALDLIPFYNHHSLRKRMTWANSNALELAHLARFNRLLPVMTGIAQGLTMDEATHLQSLYDQCPRGQDIWHDLYETDMFLNDQGEFIEDRERVSNPDLYHTSNYL